MNRIASRFVLELELGSGGMSTVFLGTDEVLDRPVAVKILKAEFMESDIGVRFRREGRTAARLSHPNIVQVYDAGEDQLDGQNISYIVMEHVPGGDLRRLIQERGMLSVEEISNLSGVAAGLAHAHDRGVVHRDIKPPNILLGESGRPKLADFGIARALDATQETRTGTYMGTARYSSPEQLQGMEITTKSDIYSLGATLYEAVTGGPLFSGTPIEVASQHVSKPPTPPGERAPVDKELEALILACLSKDPAERPTAAQVQRRLSEVASAPTPAYAAPTRTVPTAVQEATPLGERASGRQTNSRRTPLLAALVAVVALLGVLGVFSLLNNGEQQAQLPADTIPQTTTEPDAGDQVQEETTTVEAKPDPQPITPEPAPSVPKDGVQAGSNSAEQAAAQAVRDAYKLAADGNYDQSYALLSPAFRQSLAPTQRRWTSQFDTLESIRFIEGPDAQVSGDAARVEGVTIAVHTYETQRNTATWTLIREDGQWKLNSLNSIEKEIIST
ncbi:MAG: protein kinase [Rubrobacteraceae bacterium]